MCQYYMRTRCVSKRSLLNMIEVFDSLTLSFLNKLLVVYKWMVGLIWLISQTNLDVEDRLCLRPVSDLVG